MSRLSALNCTIRRKLKTTSSTNINLSNPEYTKSLENNIPSEIYQESKGSKYKPDEQLPSMPNKLWISYAAHDDPHPHKKRDKRKGEDANFIHNSSRRAVFGVFDGVGGWSSRGIDSGEFSRSLCSFSKKFVVSHEDDDEHQNLSPVKILSFAHLNTRNAKIKGSSTACLLVFDPKRNMLEWANLGDSGFILIRNGKSVVESLEQQRSFNCPFQLCHEGGDEAEASDHREAVVFPGDLLVCGTDGLFDNVEKSRIIKIVSDFNNHLHFNSNCNGANNTNNFSPIQPVLNSNKLENVIPLYPDSNQSSYPYSSSSSDPSNPSHLNLASSGLSSVLLNVHKAMQKESVNEISNVLPLSLSLPPRPSSSSLINRYTAQDPSLSSLAHSLVSLAHRIGSDKSADTPFSRAATSKGYKFSGGKRDDVTVIVAKFYQAFPNL